MNGQHTWDSCDSMGNPVEAIRKLNEFRQELLEVQQEIQQILPEVQRLIGEEGQLVQAVAATKDPDAVRELMKVVQVVSTKMDAAGKNFESELDRMMNDLRQGKKAVQQLRQIVQR